ncbi:uncharacterized protein PHACADRAFT_29309 [Phanerochaete carnosa HHB-10118-sp]|uniref:Mediator complex subunit 27 n=1 Tax=Phanerochaete carnosa (strain HHB-10118-sp) TaxID=650164 RepID=K5W4F2_PHACS|nr:uncharacterized protein PHACADRAFT_29309 [Phanerochaete carnosa HHB-10118-sp]EKM54040.1 hypothetical protein PHACADRAFT_29309 [Phanerochaete carnosa HHB-10118-sp]
MQSPADPAASSSSSSSSGEPKTQSPAVPDAAAAAAAASSDLQALKGQISLLTELGNRVESLRQTPSYLRLGAVAPSTSPIASNVSPASQAALISHGFEGIKLFLEKVQSDPVQDVLRKASESEAEDKRNLDFNHPRRNLKHNRQPSPDSPQPYRTLQPKTSLFPPDDAAAPTPLRVDDLVHYIRSYNTTNAHRLHVWTATPRPSRLNLPSELMVRFTIRDVVTVYLTLGSMPPESTIVVEGATAFGPREKKPPHSQSSYVVYQRLSQHLAKMLQSKPQASFQLVMVLLASYEDLFVRRCSACQRVTSAEGHLPPAARVWVPSEREGEEGHWDAKHPSCLQS